MKRRLLWITVVLMLAEVALVTTARASRSVRAMRQAASTQSESLRIQQYYPMMMVRVTDPIRLPDQVLLPGEYNFTMVHQGRNVSVFKADGELVGTYVIVPAWRRDSDGGLVNTEPTPGGGPDRLVAWFFPDQQYGYGFLYPES